MKVYIVQINQVRNIYPTESLAQAALQRFLSDNPEYRLIDNYGNIIYKIYAAELMAASYIALLTHKSTGEKIWIDSSNQTYEEFENYLLETYKEFTFNIVPNFYI